MNLKEKLNGAKRTRLVDLSEWQIDGVYAADCDASELLDIIEAADGDSSPRGGIKHLSEVIALGAVDESGKRIFASAGEVTMPLMLRKLIADAIIDANGLNEEARSVAGKN